MTRTSLLVLVLAGVAGCGGSDSVWSSSVSRLVLLRSGGFLAFEPTPDCPTLGAEYTLVVEGRSLSAWRCAPGTTAPYRPVRSSMSRALTAAELDALVPSLEALRVVSIDTCGADKPAVTVTVTTPSGTTEYADSFYSCNDNDDRPTIKSEALDAAAQAFDQLAFPPS